MFRFCKMKRKAKEKGFQKTVWPHVGVRVVTELLAHFRQVDMKKFIRNNILSRFGIPKALVSDIGTQFVGQKEENVG